VDVGLRGQLSVEASDERWGSRWRHCAEFEVSILLQAQGDGDDEIKRLMAGEGRPWMWLIRLQGMRRPEYLYHSSYCYTRYGGNPPLYLRCHIHCN